jgi:hypothetical protein
VFEAARSRSQMRYAVPAVAVISASKKCDGDASGAAVADQPLSALERYWFPAPLVLEAFVQLPCSTVTSTA